MITSFITPFSDIAVVLWQREHTVFLHLHSHLSQDRIRSTLVKPDFPPPLLSGWKLIAEQSGSILLP